MEILHCVLVVTTLAHLTSGELGESPQPLGNGLYDFSAPGCAGWGSVWGEYLVPFPTWPELGPGCWNSCGFDYSVGYGDGYNVGDFHRRANRRANETW